MTPDVETVNIPVLAVSVAAATSESAAAVSDCAETQISPKDSSAIAIAPETIQHAGNELFVLWLKIAATLLAARLLVNIWPVVVLTIFTLMLVATLNPMVRRLQKRLTRATAISIVVFSIIATSGGLLVLMIPPLVSQARNLIVSLPRYFTQIENAAHRMGIKVNLHNSILDISQHASNVGEAFDVLLTVLSGITAVLTVAVLTTYLLIDGQSVVSSMLGMLPRHQRLPIRQMFGEIGTKVGDYMRGQLITSVQAGAFSYVLLLVLRVPAPLPLAVLMAVADVIPMIGPLIGTVPAVLMALTLGPSKALIVLIGYVVYHQIESHIIVPRVYGKTMQLSPSIIVFSILIGAMLMGIAGAMLALPAAAAAPVVFRHVQEWRQREDEHNGSPAPVLP